MDRFSRVPEAAIAFLACARLGAVHSVVFAGFSAESLRDRVQDAKSRVVITTDEGKRGGKSIATKSIVDAALTECPLVEHVLVLKRTGGKVKWTEGRDKWWHEENDKVQPYCAPEIVSSEDPLFILYTSGSTGKVGRSFITPPVWDSELISSRAKSRRAWCTRRPATCSARS